MFYTDNAVQAAIECIQAYIRDLDEAAIRRALALTYCAGAGSTKLRNGIVRIQTSPKFPEAWQGGGATQVTLVATESTGSIIIARDGGCWGHDTVSHDVRRPWDDEGDYRRQDFPEQVYELVALFFDAYTSIGTAPDAIHDIRSQNFPVDDSHGALYPFGIACCTRPCRMQHDHGRFIATCVYGHRAEYAIRDGHAVRVVAPELPAPVVWTNPAPTH